MVRGDTAGDVSMGGGVDTAGELGGALARDRSASNEETKEATALSSSGKGGGC